MAMATAEEEAVAVKKITIGVCVMEKKVKCGSEVLSLILFHALDPLFCYSRVQRVAMNVYCSSLCFESQVSSAPMEQILRRLQAFGEFEVF